jgi:hypothetical protein
MRHYRFLFVSWIFTISFAFPLSSTAGPVNTSVMRTGHREHTKLGKTSGPIPLYRLYGSADQFKNVKGFWGKKITFQFYFLNTSDMTLYGWVNNKGSHKYKGGEQRKDPDIKLDLVDNNPVLSASQGTYLGNQVLSKTAINEIRRAIKDSGARSILFTPKPLDGYPGRFFYEISFSKKENKDQGFNDEFIFTTPPPVTNPSPPKNSN